MNFDQILLAGGALVGRSAVSYNAVICALHALRTPTIALSATYVET